MRNSLWFVVGLFYGFYCFADGKIIILNGPPCVGKSTTATELQKLIPESEIVRLDEVLIEASLDFGIKLGLFTHQNQKGPDNKYGYQGLSHFIQYVREHHICSDSELEELYNLRLKPFQKIASLAKAGVTVIFDGTVTQSNERFCESIKMLKGMDVTFVLLYLSLEGTVKRYAQSGRRSHGILHVLSFSFPWFYCLQEKEEELVVIKSSYQELSSLILNLDETIPLILRERCAKEIFNRFGLQDGEAVLLTPRLSYDLVINVQNVSAQDCAKKILGHVCREKHTYSKFFDNEYLPIPANKDVLGIVPKLSPKYLA